MTRAIPPSSRRRAPLREARHIIATALTVVAIPLVLVLGAVKTELGAVPDPTDRPWQDLRSKLSEDWRALWQDGGPHRPGLWTLIKVAARGAWTISSAPDWVMHLSSARLAEVQFSILPPDQSDPATARHRYSIEWCARSDLDPRVCGSAVAGHEALAVLGSARTEWCDERGYPEDTCAARFDELNQAFDDEWTAYRTALIAALDKPDLRGADLRGADLTSASLTGVQLSRARLDGASLFEAQMEGANLFEAQMEAANLRRAHLEGANLVNAQLEGAQLWAAELEGADLYMARLERANFDAARIERANFIAARVAGASFRSARLGGAHLGGARLEGASFNSARLAGAILRGARLDGADLRDAQLEGANLDGTWLEGAYLANAQLRRAGLMGARLNGAFLWGADLAGTDLSYAEIEWADLRFAKLEGTELVEASMAGANFSYSMLIGTAEFGLVLRNTDLAAAVNHGGALRFVDFRPAISSPASDFRNAFGDATVLLPMPDEDRPCQWPRRALPDEEFYARWRGWLALAPDAPQWEFIAPPEWHDVTPIPPDDTDCTWHD